MPPKPVLDMDMDEFRTMQNLMLKVQKQALTASGGGQTELSAEAEKEIPRHGQIITT